MHLGILASILPLAPLALGPGCSATGASRSAGAAESSDFRIVETATGATIDLPELADALADADVVFLGELHDNDVGHRLQLEITEALLPRRGELILSLEMFERDVQGALDAYLAGELDEKTFLERSRPWPNYAEHYRPAVELARREGLAVLAANVPRPLAARVVREGLRRVLAAQHAPRFALAPPGEYRDRVDALRGDHPSLAEFDPDNAFASQCIKDDAMAESIADALAAAAPARPLVVHWCGRFHSDRGLGTVERLKLRRAELDLRVVSMSAGEDLDRPLDEEERSSALYVLRVPEPVP